jgi:aspartate racemase
MRKKAVGVLGGMGTAATADLFNQIVHLTPARNDQDHLHILINNDPEVPDRTEAILHGGPSPFPKLVAGSQLLQAMGAELVAIPCNTAHYYWADLQATLEIPLLHMIRETVAFIRTAMPEVARVGVLATSGTLAVNLYQDELLGADLLPVTPTSDQIERIMEAIYAKGGIKAGITDGRPRELLCEAGRMLMGHGAETLILGCTEIPLALQSGDLPVPLVSASEALARAIVRDAYGSPSEWDDP